MTKLVQVRSILNKTKRRDPWFLDDYTLNPYSACSFNCLFCYIRGSKYGAHMEQKLSAKSNAANLLEKQLKNLSAKGRYGIIMLASATDPYLHAEAELGLTRQLLSIIDHYRFPLHLLTRSELVLRDLDLLGSIHRNAILPADLEGKLPGGAMITFSFSTVEDEIARIFEPGATLPSLRLQTLGTVSSRGFHTGVSLMPLLPWITDTTEQLQLSYSRIKAAGANYLFASPLSLFGYESGSSRTLVFRAVKKHFPHLVEKYHKLLGNSDYLPSYYSDAFQKKAAALGNEFALPATLLVQQTAEKLPSE